MKNNNRLQVLEKRFQIKSENNQNRNMFYRIKSVKLLIKYLESNNIDYKIKHGVMFDTVITEKYNYIVYPDSVIKR